ncbi:RNA-binding protein 38-like isoform X2 [Ananas comosus]|uniref:RNA-binding protein 38-like isoform X2 n=1 Tax=Ananas comosus TaxID=4615 RepID=A0A6P5F581_ANACO|nr:RNA-binding protein 38-like isoform X2 [Ananas comosus]
MASSSSSSSSPSAAPQFRSRFGDTTRTKVFVGGLAWEITSAELHRHFAQFGDILEAVVIADRSTGRSKGYGFVTFREPDSASRAVAEPNPMIGSRRANCNIAAQRRPRPAAPPPPPPPPLPPGMNQSGGVFEGSTGPRFNRVPAQMPLPPLIYPPNMGYPTYPTDYAYHHILGVYGPGSPPTLGPQPFPYTYVASPRGSFHSPLGGLRARTPISDGPDGWVLRALLFAAAYFQLQLPPRARQNANTTVLHFHFGLRCFHYIHKPLNLPLQLEQTSRIILILEGFWTTYFLNNHLH